MAEATGDSVGAVSEEAGHGGGMEPGGEGGGCFDPVRLLFDGGSRWCEVLFTLSCDLWA